MSEKDTRRIYRLEDDGSWRQLEMRDVPRNSTIAVIDGPDLQPTDVQHWVTEGEPYQGENGVWTVQVIPITAEAKTLPPKE